MYETPSIIVSAIERGDNKKSLPEPDRDHSIDKSLMGMLILDSVAIEWESISAPAVADKESPSLMSCVMRWFSGEHPEHGHW